MKWTICGVLLVVVAVTARKEKGDGQGMGKGVESPFLTTISKIAGNVEERQLAEASWYCYEMNTLAEEVIGTSQVAIFAGGANKEGKTIEVGKLSLLIIDKDRSKGQYCAVVPTNTNKEPLTPNNDKIKYIKKDCMKFYSMKVFGRDPLSILEGFNRLKATLTKNGNNEKVDLHRPMVIYNLGEVGGEVLFPEK